MDDLRESIRKANQKLEELENSEASQHDIDKKKVEIRTLEAEHQKARKKYLDAFQTEKDDSNLEEDIEVLEDIQEDLVEDEEENASEALKAIRKQKEALDRQKKLELDKVLDPDAPPNKEKQHRKKFQSLIKVMH